MESVNVELKGISQSLLFLKPSKAPILLMFSSVLCLLLHYFICLLSISEISLTLRFSIEQDYEDSKPSVVKSENSSDTETGDFKKAKRARPNKIAQAANNNKTHAAGIPFARHDPESEYGTEGKAI